MSNWQDRVELHRIYESARSNRDSFFEKLAILDGGTVALVITAVLGPWRGNVPHKYLVGVGLTVLVLAMLTLLLRNLFSAELEFHLVAETAQATESYGSKMQERARRLYGGVHACQYAGALLSAMGIVLLTIEVWLIL